MAAHETFGGSFAIIIAKIPSLFLPVAATPHPSRAGAEGALLGFGAGFRTGICGSVTLALQQLSGIPALPRSTFPAAGGGLWAAGMGTAPHDQRAGLMVGLDGLETFSSLINSGILWV